MALAGDPVVGGVNGAGPPDPLSHIPALGAARDLAAPAVDSSEEGVRWGEVKVGLRCAGCGERSHKGFEFLRVQVVMDPRSGERVAMKSTMTACARLECDYAFTCGMTATAVRRINDDWLYMDDPRMKAMFNPEAN